MASVTTIIYLNHRNSISSLIAFRNIFRPEFQTLKSSSHIRFTHKQLFYSTDSTNFNESKQFEAFKAKQAKMQCDDGYPVHLKGGLSDKILYHITVGACVIGLVQCFQLFYDLVKRR